MSRDYGLHSHMRRSANNQRNQMRQQCAQQAAAVSSVRLSTADARRRRRELRGRGRLRRWSTADATSTARTSGRSTLNVGRRSRVELGRGDADEPMTGGDSPATTAGEVKTASVLQRKLRQKICVLTVSISQHAGRLLISGLCHELGVRLITLRWPVSI